MAGETAGQPADSGSQPSARVRPRYAGATVIEEVPRAALRAEIATLDSRQPLLTAGELRVYCTGAESIPCVLREIGRLRESTFRAAGEGTGKCADLDAFDAWYLHLFVWDARAEAVVGAYRLGLANEILSTRGKRGLYTFSLFTYPSQMLREFTPAIELGRSFVRVEYQRSYIPLLMLWRGIGRFIERAPQ